MKRTVIALLVAALASTVSGASTLPAGLPDNPVMHRPAVELGRVQVSIDAKFLSVEETFLNEIGLEAFVGPASEPEFVTFSIDGAGAVTETGSVPHVGAPPTGWGDMYWCGSFLWGAWDQQVRAYNTDGTYAGTYFWGPLDAAQAIDYSGSWWYASSPGNYLWRGQWDWTPGGTPAWENITTHTLPDVSGIAYDASIARLWVLLESCRVRQYGLDDGPMLAEIPLVGTLGSARACCMSNTTAYGPALLVLHVTPRSGDWLVFYDLSDTAVETVSWASIKALYR